MIFLGFSVLVILSIFKKSFVVLKNYDNFLRKIYTDLNFHDKNFEHFFYRKFPIFRGCSTGDLVDFLEIPNSVWRNFNIDIKILYKTFNFFSIIVKKQS